MMKVGPFIKSTFISETTKGAFVLIKYQKLYKNRYSLIKHASPSIRSIFNGMDNVYYKTALRLSRGLWKVLHQCIYFVSQVDSLNDR